MRIAVPTALLCLSLLTGDPKEELRKAAKRAVGLESYSFKAEMSIEGGLGALGNNAPPPLEGQYQKDVGTLLTLGDFAQIARKGDRVAVKHQKTDWQYLDSLAGKRQGGMLKSLFRGIKPPHEELKDFETLLKEVKKADRKEAVNEKECAVYSGELTEEAAKKLNPMSDTLSRFRNAGIEQLGSAKVWIDGDGAIQKYEITTSISGDFQGQGFDISLTRSVQLSKIGATKVDLPEGARKILEATKDY